MQSFDKEVEDRLRANRRNEGLRAAAHAFMELSTEPKYSYNFSWLGRPIIQYPQDIVAMQELIWKVQPDLIVETGIAHGGSLVFYASLLELNSVCGGSDAASVVGIDIDLRAHNRAAIEAHPLSRRIQLIQGSSTAPDIVEKVRLLAERRERVMICLDSNHTHEHVLAELNAYAPFTTPGSYCVVFDTVIEHFPEGMYPDRSWGPGNNPQTAVRQFLATHPEFVVDEAFDNKLMITVAPGGYLRRVR